MGLGAASPASPLPRESRIRIDSAMSSCWWPSQRTLARRSRIAGTKNPKRAARAADSPRWRGGAPQRPRTSGILRDAHSDAQKRASAADSAPRSRWLK
jgi:hypothetical protein